MEDVVPEFYRRDDITAEPRVGIGVVAWWPYTRRVLLGLRKGSHGAGEWSLPGGALEPGEHPYECARRELYEETGILGKEFSAVPHWTNDFYPEFNRHFITLYIECKLNLSQTAKLEEPEKCERWEECPWNNLPSPLFAGVVELDRFVLGPVD